MLQLTFYDFWAMLSLSKNKNEGLWYSLMMLNPMGPLPLTHKKCIWTVRWLPYSTSWSNKYLHSFLMLHVCVCPYRDELYPSEIKRVHVVKKPAAIENMYAWIKGTFKYNILTLCGFFLSNFVRKEFSHFKSGTVAVGDFQRFLRVSQLSLYCFAHFVRDK